MNVAELGGETRDLPVQRTDAAARAATAGRFAGLDMLKGMLLLFVIIGHFPNIPVEQSYLKAVIYSFHMPLFIIVTGYLFNAEKWSAAPFIDFLRHYLTRLLIPWAIASAAYYVLRFAEGDSLRSIIKAAIFQPWSLLWFVPAVFLMMAATVLLTRRGVRPVVIFAVSTVLVLGLQLWFLRTGRSLDDFIQSLVVLGDRRYTLYFPFFAFGFFLRRHGTEMFTPLTAGATIVLASVIYPSGWVIDDPTSFLFLNFLVGAAAIALARTLGPQHAIGPLAFIGRESLPIYLWHYMIIVIARHFTTGLTFVLVSALGIAGLVAAIYLLSRQRGGSAVNMVVFGR
jgi:fucose 4-O-acetylase-like acetyltransferase